MSEQTKPDPSGAEDPKLPQRRFGLGTILLLGILFLWVQSWFAASQFQQIPYSKFLDLLDQDKIAEVVIGTNDIRGKLKDGAKGPAMFTTNRVDKPTADLLRAKKVKFTRRIESTFLPTLLSWVAPALLFIGVWWFLLRRMAKGAAGGGFLSIGKSKAKVYVETEVETRFEDVAGVDEARAELVEVVDFLKAPDSYGRLGARMPKGVLLVGPPGTGKTLLAKAVAGEAGVPFFSISGSDFVEMFVGVGAARVRDLFEQARKKAPCIIFIDELDALGRSRTAGGFGGHDEKEQTLNQLLVELDGFDASTGVVLLGATNRPEVLDPALLRAGRFDRQILVDRPDKLGRTAILNVHLRGKKVADDLDPAQIAALTPGFTGADLANLVNEAALTATRRGADEIELGDFTVAVERIVAGLERKSRLLNPKERKIVAHHEMGHTLVAAALPGTDPVHKVSIVPRGMGALGYTMQRPTDDRFLMTKTELLNKLMVLFGGRAAEEVVFGHLSNGASDDIARATDIAREMVERYGMALGPVAFARQPTGPLDALNPNGARRHELSEASTREIERATRELLESAYASAVEILRANRSLLDESAALLLEKETLTEDELAPFFDRLHRSKQRIAS